MGKEPSKSNPSETIFLEKVKKHMIKQRNLKNLTCALVTTTLLTLLSTNSFAVRTNQFTRSNTLTYEKLEDGRNRNSHVHNNYDMIFTLGGSWVDAPLTVKNQGNTTLTGVEEIIPEMWVMHLGAAAYLKPWLQLGLTTSYNWADINNQINTPGDNISGFSDIEAKLKIRLINKKRWSFNIIPLVTIPLKGGEFQVQNTGTSMDGETEYLFSDEGFGFGGQVVLEYLFKYFQLVGNVGYKVNDKAKTIDSTGKAIVDYSQELLTSVGAYVPIYKTFGANLEFARRWSNPLFNDNINQNEITLGLSAAMTKNLHVFTAAGVGNPFASNDGNDLRLSAGIKFAPRIWSEKRQPIELVTTENVEAGDPVVVTEQAPVVVQNIAKINCDNRFVFGDTNIAVVRFPNDVGNLNYSNVTGLRDVVSQLNTRISDISSITIIGHTSRSGSHAYNQRLSEKRANNVMTYLNQRGVPQSLMVARGLGETHVLDESDTERTRSTSPAAVANRRTEFKVTMNNKYGECF